MTLRKSDRVELNRSSYFSLPAWAAILGIAFAVLFVYSNSYDGVFVYDDGRNIEENPYIRDISMFEWLWRTPEGTTLSERPVAQWTLAFNYAFGGLSVQGYHVVNVAIHMASAVLLFLLIRHVALCVPACREKPWRVSWAAFAAAIWWAVHPLQTQAVTYIIQRTEALAAMFYLATLYFAARSRSGNRAYLWGGLSVVVCLLGIGAKEIVVSAPAAVMLYDWVFGAKTFKETFRERKILYVALFMCWIPALWRLLRGSGASRLLEHSTVSSLEYFFIQTRVIPHYLRLAVLPLSQVFDYYDWQVPRAGLSMAVSIALLGGVLVFGLYAAFRRRWFGFPIVLFFMLLAPTSSFLPLLTHAAEHRMYLALAPVLFMLVCSTSALVEYASLRLPSRFGLSRRAAPLLTLFLAAIVLWHGALAHSRNRVYHSEASIWRDTLEKRPSNPRACLALGECLLREGKVREGILLMKRSLEIGHHSRVQPGAHHNLGNVYFDLGKNKAAVSQYTEALKGLGITPDIEAAYVNRSLAHMKMKQYRKAVEDQEKAMRFFADDPVLRVQHAYALTHLGRFDEARRHAARASKLGHGVPSDLANRINKGLEDSEQ